MFSTIRQVARTGLASESLIRRLVAQGRCPGIYSGNRFLVNTEQLREFLEEQSRAPKGGAKR